MRFFVKLLAIAILFEPKLFATTAFLTSDEELISQASVVVHGTVDDVVSRINSQGQLHTYVTLTVKEIFKGRTFVQNQKIVIREVGGEADGRVLKVFGGAKYEKDKDVVVALEMDSDGYFRTFQMFLGKFDISHEDGYELLSRDFDHATVLESQNRSLVSVSQDRKRTTEYFRALASATEMSTFGYVVANSHIPEASIETQAVKFLATPHRFFEPDSGQPVNYYMSPQGDAVLGNAASLRVVQAAMAAWSNVSGSNLYLKYAGTSSNYNDCARTIVFNDPQNKISDPISCSGGVLAVGGFCGAGETKYVNGIKFNRIAGTTLIVNNGWGSCWFWNESNLSEVLTHELGHTIGFAHASESGQNPTAEESDATMNWMAHFDGRGASLRSWDMAAVRTSYPGSRVQPTPTPTPVPTPTPTPKPTPVEVTKLKVTKKKTFAPDHTAMTLNFKLIYKNTPVSGGKVQLKITHPNGKVQSGFITMDSKGKNSVTLKYAYIRGVQSGVGKYIVEAVGYKGSMKIGTVSKKYNIGKRAN